LSGRDSLFDPQNGKLLVHSQSFRRLASAPRGGGQILSTLTLMMRVRSPGVHKIFSELPNVTPVPFDVARRNLAREIKKISWVDHAPILRETGSRRPQNVFWDPTHMFVSFLHRFGIMASGET